MSITFNRCSSTMTGVPVLTIWRRHCQILPFMGGTILTLRKFSTYYQLPINGEICTESIFSRLHHGLKESSFRPLSQQVHHLRETHVCGVCTSIKLTSLIHASVEFRLPNFGQLFRTQIEDHWGHEVSGTVLGYDQNGLLHSVFFQLQNGLLYCHQQFLCPISVECLGLDCKVEYTDAMEGIMPESHNIGVQYTDSDLDNTFQGRVPSFLGLYFSWTLPNQILKFQELLPAGKSISTFSKR